MLNGKALPPPSPDRIEKFESHFEVILPDDYKGFLARSNGIVPAHVCFDSTQGEQLIERFLPLLNDPEMEPDQGPYDIAVVASQLSTRLTDQPNAYGLPLIPIALLFAGDFVVLDFRNSGTAPAISVWEHEVSQEFAPVAHVVSTSFSDFLALLRECGEH